MQDIYQCCNIYIYIKYLNMSWSTVAYIITVDTGSDFLLDGLFLTLYNPTFQAAKQHSFLLFFSRPGEISFLCRITYLHAIKSKPRINEPCYWQGDSSQPPHLPTPVHPRHMIFTPHFAPVSQLTWWMKTNRCCVFISINVSRWTETHLRPVNKLQLSFYGL